MQIKDWSEVAEQYLQHMPNANKIGVVTDTAETSAGVGRVTRELSKNFSRKNLEVVLYTIEGRIPNEKKLELEQEGIEIREINRSSSTDPREISRIKKIFEEDDLDWINTHGFFLAMAATFSSVKTLKTYHAHITVRSEIKKQPLNWMKWVIEEAPSVWLADKRVSISKYAAKQMKRFYLSNSEVIYNGIDTERFKKKETNYRSKIGIPEDAYVVGSLSALKRYKNQTRTLEIFAEKYADQKNAYLVIGGDGPEKENLEDYAKELGIENETKFLGYISDEKLVEFYNSIDVFIYPSKWEGFGMPPVEAKFCGCEIELFPNAALKEIKSIDRLQFN